MATALPLLIALMSACSADPEPAATTAPPITSTPDSSTPATSTGPPRIASAATAVPDAASPADRPYDVVVPSDYTGTTALPLVLGLHGYAATGAEIDSYLGLLPLVDDRGFLYVSPDGSADSRGTLFWDATDACCNFTGAPLDDAGYLADLISQVQADYAVDPARIYVVGHSNGGFMAYRMACEHADLVAAIVSIAGATFADPDACAPDAPVSVLQIHGDADEVISYSGGDFPAPYPGALDSVATWAGYDQCEAGPAPLAPPRDLEANLPGPESTATAFEGCAGGSAVELWTVGGGAHVPALSPSFPDQVVDWLYAHPKQR